MKISRRSVSVLGTFLSVAALSAGCRSGAGGAENAAVEAQATVRTAPIRLTTVAETVEGFGAVTAGPGRTRTLSVAFECKVRRVPVSEGTIIEAGTLLAEVEPSPETALELARARDEMEAAVDQAGLIEQRFGMQLATREDLQNAEQRRRLAQITLRNLESRAGGPQLLRAEGAGVVAGVDAQPGQILPPGAPLVRTVPGEGLMVRLGIESADASRVTPGQRASLEPVEAGERSQLTGRVASLAGAVDAQTRLVDVYIGFDETPPLRLNDYVRGRIETGRHDAIVVPRDALVLEEDRTVLFTVENGRAVRHVVRSRLDDGEVVEVEGPGVVAGAEVVVQGAAELQDGMSVVTEGAR
jgi:RND family efflux transporter MFP subunit